MRLALRALMVGVLVIGIPTTAWAQSDRAGDATIFTLAGGGNASPREGAAASDVRVGGTALAGLPDGAVATTDEHGRPLVVAIDGRVHLLSGLPNRAQVSVLAAEPAGSLLAAGRFGPMVWRLAPGAAIWQRAFDLRQLPGWDSDAGSQIAGLASLPGGGLAVSTSSGVWRIGPDGRIERVPLPKSDAPSRATGRLAALPNGTLAFGYGGSSGIAFVEPGGRGWMVAGPANVYLFPGIAALGDGRVLRAEGMIEALRPDGSAVPVAGARPQLGAGDGGPALDAFVAGHEVTVAGDGAIVISENTPFGGPAGPFDLPALTNRERGLGDSFGAFERQLLRIVVAPGTIRPLVAITPATFNDVRQGRVRFTSTFSGRATLTIERAGRLVARARQPVSAGSGELGVPRTVRGDLRLTLRVVGDHGEAAMARLAVTTERVLPRRRALRTIRRIANDRADGDGFGGSYTEIGHCRRVGERRLDCQAIETQYESEPYQHRRSCAYVFVARLRPDGVRVSDEGGRRACRRLS